MENISTFRLISVVILGTVFLFSGCEENEVNDTSVTDIDGNVYKVVTIGRQIWMAENLKTTRYRTGDRIPSTDPADLDISGESNPIYQWSYNGDEKNAAVYGRLYTWYTVIDTLGLCPDGWHVPAREEWAVLAEFIGGADTGGGKLKEKGSAHWLEPNTGATDTTGFTALPGGYRGFNGDFFFLGHSGIWWSSTESDHGEGSAWIRSLNRYSASFYLSFTFNVASGFSVRCIKD
jgi:uncharacterized protein (TIGR02145 family)